MKVIINKLMALIKVLKRCFNHSNKLLKGRIDLFKSFHVEEESVDSQNFV